MKLGLTTRMQKAYRSKPPASEFPHTERMSTRNKKRLTALVTSPPSKANGTSDTTHDVLPVFKVTDLESYNMGSLVSSFFHAVVLCSASVLSYM